MSDSEIIIEMPNICFRWRKPADPSVGSITASVKAKSRRTEFEGDVTITFEFTETGVRARYVLTSVYDTVVELEDVVELGASGSNARLALTSIITSVREHYVTMLAIQDAISEQRAQATNQLWAELVESSID